MKAECPTCNRMVEDSGYWKGPVINNHTFVCSHKKGCGTEFEVEVRVEDDEDIWRDRYEVGKQSTQGRGQA